MTTLNGDGHILVDGLTIPVGYSVTSSGGSDDFTVSFSTLADYGRCRDGKTVQLQTGNGSKLSGFVSGAFGDVPVRFVRLADD
ncbi:hypothetical protein [Ensifer canadensis]|uniref:hypothetical protein n=1 Tax=Ensifer canadensis TaxID=555315 RepID=UPI0035E3D035